MIRVLITDDSETFRMLLRSVLESDPGIVVVGEASDGVEALELVEKLRPSLVTMDVIMPGMSGFDATKEIMIRFPTPTLLLTARCESGDPVFTGNSFRCGAVTALPKLPDPSSPDFDESVQFLLNAVRDAAQIQACRHWRYAPLLPRRGNGDDLVRAVAITTGISGARSLEKLVSSLPENFAASVFVAMQAGSGFRSGFAAWLSQHASLPVRIAEPGQEIEEGVIYCPSEYRHLTVECVRDRAVIGSGDAPARRGYRPSSTLLLESLANVYGPTALALLLGPSPEELMLGVCSIRLSGGRVLAMQTPTHGLHARLGTDLTAALADASLSFDQLRTQLCEVCVTETPLPTADNHGGMVYALA